MAASLDQSILKGLFQEEFEKQEGIYVGTKAAPLQWIRTKSGIYTVAVTPAVLRTEEQGYDPLQPLSFEAPSRPVRDQFEDRMFNVRRYSEHYFIDDISKVSAREAGDYSLEDRAARRLSGLHRGRHELLTARLYMDSGNYGDTDTVAIANFWGAVEDAAATLGSADRAALVAPPSVVRALRRSADFLNAIGGGNTGIIGSMSDFQAYLSEVYGLELLVSNAKYSDNATVPNTNSTSFIWEEAGTNWVGIVGLSNDSHLAPSFATTVAFTDKFEDPAIAQLWDEEILDPRGLKVISESVFDVVVGDSSLGVQLTVTGI